MRSAILQQAETVPEEQAKTLAEILTEATGCVFRQGPTGTHLDPYGMYQHYGYLCGASDDSIEEERTEPSASTIPAPTIPFRPLFTPRSTEGRVLPFQIPTPAPAQTPSSDPIEQPPRAPEDPSQASTIINLPGLAPYEPGDGTDIKRHVLEIKIPELHAYNTLDAALQAYVGYRDLSAEVETIHTTPTTRKDSYRTLHEAGFVASDKLIPNMLFVGVVSRFVFRFDSRHKEMYFLVGPGDFPKNCQALAQKAILRVALADSKTGKAYVENYDIFRRSAFTRALRIHNIESSQRQQQVHLFQKFLPRETYEDVHFALVDCGYKTISLRSFDDIAESYGGVHLASCRKIA